MLTTGDAKTGDETTLQVLALAARTQVSPPSTEMLIEAANALVEVAVPLPMNARERRETRAHFTLAVGDYDDAAEAWLKAFNTTASNVRAAFVKAVDDLKRETREAIKGKKAEAADNDEKLEDSPADTDGE